jgi:hypothetical protein
MTPPVPPPFPTEPPRIDGLATAALVLGLLALFCLGPLAGLPAIVCGITAGARIHRAGGALGGSGRSLAGAVLGAFGSLVWVVGGLAAVRWTQAKVQEVKGWVGEMQETVPLAMLEVAVESYHAGVGSWPGAEGRVDAEVDTARLIEALGARPGLEPAPGGPEAWPGLVKNGRLVDRWGNLLHVAYDLDGDGQVVLAGRTLGPKAVAIWSDGPNGLNEWGEGDDLTAW